MTAANLPNRLSGTRTIRVVDVPKLTGIGYFGATAKGIAEAAKEIGTIEARTDVLAKPVVDDQAAIIEASIAHAVDGILFAANDPVAIAPGARHRSGSVALARTEPFCGPNRAMPKPCLT